MNHQRFLLLLAGSTLFLISISGYSFAQNPPSENQVTSNAGIFIFVQTFVENSEGKLVTYLTSNKFTDLNFDVIVHLLEQEASENDPIVTIDGKKFQVIQRAQTIPYDKENVIASTLLTRAKDGEFTLAARFAHDGYPIMDGDKVKSVWTFIRPID